MRQIKLSNPGGLNNLQLVQSPKPSPGKGEILIKVFASSLNYHDLLVALGRIPTQDGRVYFPIALERSRRSVMASINGKLEIK